MHILYLIRDPYPTFRPDVWTLFGQRLRGKGIFSDLVATVRHGVSISSKSWPGGNTFLVFSSRNPLFRVWQVFSHDLKMLWCADRYDALVVRDRIFTGVLALILVRSVPVHYWMSFPFPEEDHLRSQLPGRSALFRLALRIRGSLSGWLLYRFVVPKASHLFVQSDQMAEVVRQKAGVPCEMTVVPMGVDEQQLRNLSIPKTLPALEGRFVLAYLGALDQVRRIDFLLEVILWLKQRSPEMTLLLIGDASTPEEKLGLVQCIERMGLTSDVIMTGQLPMSDAWACLRSGQIGLSAIPRGEVFDVSSPTKIVEYLALGIPVVANDIPDQLKLVRATGAGLCVEMDVEKFGQAILKIASNYSRYKQNASACFDALLKTRGYDHLADVVSEVILRSKGR